MSVARSERFVYFQNKANHYHHLKNIKPVLKRQGNLSHLPHSHKSKSFRERSIIDENRRLIEKLVTIAHTNRPQLGVDGSYSRYNKVERSFRSKSPYKEEIDRNITLDNSDRRKRIKQTRPVVGSNDIWTKEYCKSLDCQRNLRKFGQRGQKGQLNIVTDKFIPEHLRTYALKNNLDSSIAGKRASVPLQKLFELPAIGNERRVDWHFDQLTHKEVQL